MKKLLTILFSLFLLTSIYSQEQEDNQTLGSSEPEYIMWNEAVSSYGISQQEAPIKTPWKKGNFFIGVNSDVLGISISTLSLSPFIGYALNDNNMVYGSVWYADEPRISTFKIGWNKRVYYSAYVGLSGSMYGENATWQKAVSLEFGVCKNLWSWLMISPKIIFTDNWDEGNADFNFSSSVSFAVKL